MIHYTCDRCQKRIDTDQATLYQVRIEVSSTLPPEPQLDADEAQAAREFMEMDETIEDLDGSGSEATDPAALSFDLCPECFTRYYQDPLGLNAAALGFSKN